MSKNQTGGCPCGGATYESCCGRWHAGDAAPTAEALMRSRYTAFVRGDEPYLLATWHASKRPRTVGFEPAAKWLGLEVLEHEQISATSAEVEFIARYRVGGGSAVRLRERSRFVREGGRWYYLDGLQLRAGRPD
jgi:SEC-C motif-containing protein